MQSVSSVNLKTMSRTIKSNLPVLYGSGYILFPLLLLIHAQTTQECVFGSNKRVADIADVQKYPEILQGIPGLSKDQINKVAQASQSDQNKQRVIQEASALANEGLAFGMPWFVVEKPNGEKQSTSHEQQHPVRRLLLSLY